jgi:hypothetical protein
MNERITKIVIDTLGKEGVVNSRAFGHWALSDEELEKFAELIVRECADIAKGEPANFSDRDPYKIGRRSAGIDVLKHFGVEE